MKKECFPKPVSIGPCEAVPVVFLSTDIDGVDDTINPPENGTYRNTIVTYTLTKHVYIYDSAGIPTRTNYEGVIDEELSLESENAVQNKVVTKAIADTAEALQTNINLEVMAREQDRDNLQANINKLADKEAEDVSSLKTDVEDVNQRVDDIINSPDVRYIVSTYAELEAIDKATIGDQDYARVLQDETHEDASTYYQFSKTNTEWDYVGQTGPYYTKQESDSKFATQEVVTAGLAEKQDTLVSGINLKTINGESILGEGNIDIDGGGGAVNILSSYLASPAADDVYSASYINSRLDGFAIKIGANSEATLGSMIAIGNSAKATKTNSVALGSQSVTSREGEVSIGRGDTATNIGTRYLANIRAGERDTDAVNVKQLNDAIASTQTGANHDTDNLLELTESLPNTIVSDVTGTATDGEFKLQVTKNTLNNNGGTTTEEIPIPLNGALVAPTVSYTADVVSVNNTEIEAAKGTQEGMVGRAGIMSAFQATQLAALAAAYQAEEKGTILYEGTASVNNVELSESGLAYDHLIVVGEYMGMGSTALEQQVSTVFYPSVNVKSFQMNATDLTVGDTPMETTLQDIWMISEDGMELDIVSSIKCEKGAGTLTCMPDTTSMFTITKVIGFGKKLLDQPAQS